MKDEIEFQPLNPQSLWSDSEVSISPELALTPKEINDLYADAIAYSYNNLKYSTSPKWLMSPKPNFAKKLRKKKPKEELGSLLENLL